MTIADEITEVFKAVFGVETNWFLLDRTIELLQEKMELAESENDQKVLVHQDKFNELTFYHGLLGA